MEKMHCTHSMAETLFPSFEYHQNITLENLELYGMCRPVTLGVVNDVINYEAMNNYACCL